MKINKTKLKLGTAVLFLLILNPQLSTALAQGTAFTYQGRLMDNGAPANGVYEMEFRLFDLVSNGTQQGSPVAFAKTVTNGLFTVALDFGSSVFDGSPRWLEIALRPAGSTGAFTNLVPRQALTATPYAILAGRLNGPLPSANLSGTYANALALSNPANTFTGNAGGLTNVNANNLVGTIATAGRVANSATTATSANTPNTIVARDGTGNFSAGTVSANSLYWGASFLSPDQTGSIELGNSLSNGTVPFIDFHYGVGSDQDYNVRLINDANRQLTAEASLRVTDSITVDQFGQNNGSVYSNSLTFGSASGEGIASRRTPGPTQWGLDFYTDFQPRMTILNNGNIGIGTNAPAEKLQIAGNVLASGTICGSQFTGNGAGISNVNALSVGGIDSDGFWRTTGNANTIPGLHFLGTTDHQPLQMLVEGVPALRLEPHGASAASLVGGFSQNTVSGATGAVVVGGGASGLINEAVGRFSFIGSGLGNANQSDCSVIGGGTNNTVQPGSAAGVIGGGQDNLIQSNSIWATIAGGQRNIISNDAGAATIAGGFVNVIESNSGSSAIGGGNGNTVRGNSPYSTIAGGRANTSSGYSATVGGGQGNISSGIFATVGGGAINTSSGTFATVGGGRGNTSSGPDATVGGGEQNTSIGDYAMVGGGVQNTASDLVATVSGGYRNVASGPFSTVSGGGGFGDGNVASGSFSTVSGGGGVDFGEGNVASGSFSTVSGGIGNAATNTASTVAGGAYNLASGQNSFIGGGSSNVAAGFNSFAAGYRAKANHDGSFVWADSQDFDFSSTANDQFSIRAAGGVRINGGGGQTLMIVEDRGLFVKKGDVNWSVGGALVDNQGGSIELGPQFSSAVTTPYIDFHYSSGAINVEDYNVRLINDANHQLTLNGNLHVTGTISPPSDRNLKAGFEPPDPKAILEKVAALPITRWHYTNDPATTHIGPVAQDFYAAFNVGADDKHIATVDADGVALAAIQGLNQKLEEKLAAKDARIEALEVTVAQLKELLGEIKKKESHP